MTRQVGRTHITPPELARQRGITADKILTWIRRGELRAINVSEGSIRPRYLIALTDLADFDNRRAVVPPEPEPPRQPRTEVPSYV